MIRMQHQVVVKKKKAIPQPAKHALKVAYLEVELQRLKDEKAENTQRKYKKKNKNLVGHKELIARLIKEHLVVRWQLQTTGYLPGSINEETQQESHKAWLNGERITELVKKNILIPAAERAKELQSLIMKLPNTNNLNKGQAEEAMSELAANFEVQLKIYNRTATPQRQYTTKEQIQFHAVVK